MEAVFISRQHTAYSFAADSPAVCEVEAGSILKLETSDEGYELLSRGVPEAEIRKKINPVTGPVSVRGAGAGDVLRIEILAIEITRAWSVWLKNFGSLGDKTSETRAWEIPIIDNRLILSPRLSVALDPMIGCIGVAPKKGVGSTVAPVGRWGGNLDLRELRAGATLLLPVFHPGALLSIGDLHAAMGTGEPCCMAIEAAGTVTVRVEIEKHRKLEFPRLQLDGATVCIGLGNKIEQAELKAIDQAYEVLTEDLGMQPSEAFAYASSSLELRLGGPASPIALAYIPHPIFTSEAKASSEPG
jgi:amidase